jgi:ureidoglycolate hydrolase
VDSKGVFHVRLLERHAFSTQTFIPMANQDGVGSHYLAIVCLNGPGKVLFCFNVSLD